MGVVKMRRQFEFRSRGYPYGTDILYVYCDKCGSFSIKKYIDIKRYLLIIATLGIMITGTLVAPQPGLLHYSTFFFGLASFILVFIFLCDDAEYQCRKCKNTQIIVNNPKDYASEIHKYNTWNYPPDMEVIDVPDELTQKRYQGYWDDDYR